MNAIINFIKTIPPAHQRALLSWYRTSIFAFVLTGSIIAFIQCCQLYQWYSARTRMIQAQIAAQSLNHHMEHFQKLNSQEQLLQKKMAFIDTFASTNKKIAAIIQALTSLIGPAGIVSCSVQADALTLTVRCNTIETVTYLATELAHIPDIHNLTLVSLKPKLLQVNTIFIATLQARIA
jgi:hypothetical protein